MGLLNLPDPLPEWVLVDAAATFMDVTSQQVQTLVDHHQVDSRCDGGMLLVRRDSLIAYVRDRPRDVKPLSDLSLRLVKDALALRLGESPSPWWGQADQANRDQALTRADTLRGDPQPAALMRAWSANTPAPSHWWATPHQVHGLRSQFSGFSHPAADLASAGQVELRVSELPNFTIHRTPAACVMVIVHVDASMCWPVRVADAVFDLASHARSREDTSVERMVQS